jgi:hypothetical protein
MLDQGTINARQRVVEDALVRYPRVAITGGPRTGKTWLATTYGLDREVVHTDTWKGVEWDKQPALIVAACDPLQRFLLEGVQVPRALRKGLKVDALIWLDDPAAAQSPAQRAMGKAVATVLHTIRAQLTIPVIFADAPASKPNAP